jgi:hypothetical protein
MKAKSRTANSRFAKRQLSIQKTQEQKHATNTKQNVKQKSSSLHFHEFGWLHSH